MSGLPTPPPGSNLGGSSPLVRVQPPPAVSGVSSLEQQSLSTSNSNTDHPLSFAPAAPPAHHMDVELSGRSPPAAYRATVASPPAQGFSLSTPPPPKPVVTKQAAAITPTATLDDLADAFLSGDESSLSSLTGNDKTLLKPPSLPDDLSDLDRLRALVERRAWGDVVTLAAKLLRGPSSHYASIYSTLLNNTGSNLPALESQQAELVEILTLQCTGLLKMRRYPELKREIELWTFCHFAQNTAPDWVPWSLHILAASTFQYTSDDKSDKVGQQKATEMLWNIRSSIQTDDLASLMQVEHALTNVFLRQKQWRMALQCLQRMIELLPAACLAEEAGENHPMNSAFLLETAYRCELLSRQGRILLQIGALPEAASIFQEAESSWHDIESKAASQEHHAIIRLPAQLSANQGLLSFAYGKHDEALEFFRRAVNHIRQTKVDRSYRASEWIGSDLVGVESLHSLYSDTMNNMALCAIYTCRLQESIHLMEALVRENPTAYLTERVALNLW